MRWIVASVMMLMLALMGCKPEEGESRVIRIGCFPNVTHVQGLVARNMSRTGEGWFERYVPGYTIEWQTYQAGPAAAEAIFGRSAELTYIGPSPAINAYAVSGGREMRLLAGAVNGGAALLVRPGAGITGAADMRGRSIATPQLGNTQDISCRAWLAAHGLSSTPEGGGDVRVSPTGSSLQLQLMKQGKVDACWTVEPWVSLMEKLAGAKILVQEPDVVTTVLAGRVRWLREHPAEAAALLRAHRELTQWILDHPDEAQRRVTAELTELTQTEMDPELTASAWRRLHLTNEIDTAGLEKFVKDAQAADLLERVPPLSEMLWKSTAETPRTAAAAPPAP